MGPGCCHSLSIRYMNWLEGQYRMQGMANFTAHFGDWVSRRRHRDLKASVSNSQGDLASAHHTGHVVEVFDSSLSCWTAAGAGQRGLAQGPSERPPDGVGVVHRELQPGGIAGQGHGRPAAGRQVRERERSRPETHHESVVACPSHSFRKQIAGGPGPGRLACQQPTELRTTSAACPDSSPLLVRRFSSLAVQLRQEWHEAYYNTSIGNYGGGEQTSMALALYLQVPPTAYHP